MKQNQTLAEIESYFRKVARVTGMHWGLAEEAGKAARWLAAFDLPGPELMLAHLQQIEGRDYHNHKPVIGTEQNSKAWHAQGGVMCPIITGAAIADRAKQILAGDIIQLDTVAYPILLAATIGQASRFFNIILTTSWAGVKLSCYGNGIRIEGNRDDLLLAQVEAVNCQQSFDTLPEQLPSTLAYAIDSDIWQVVDQLAFRTYAPATEQSRAGAGAGAGLTDND
ncbi:MAG: hypothetical protein ACI9KN_000678 [Gammaproteobacteria bacterium]|jgi:hypothetical protein